MYIYIYSIYIHVAQWYSIHFSFDPHLFSPPAMGLLRLPRPRGPRGPRRLAPRERGSPRRRCRTRSPRPAAAPERDNVEVLQSVIQ